MIYEMVIVIVFVVIIIVGNFLVIVVLYKDLFGELWMIVNYFLLNFVVVDLIMGFVVEFMWVF